MLTPNSLCNACRLRFLTMVQKEAKVPHSSTQQRVAVHCLVNTSKTAPTPLPVARVSKASDPFYHLPAKGASMAPSAGKGTPMMSATKTTTMRFAWNPPAETLRPKMSPPSFPQSTVGNPYVRTGSW